MLQGLSGHADESTKQVSDLRARHSSPVAGGPTVAHSKTHQQAHRQPVDPGPDRVGVAVYGPSDRGHDHAITNTLDIAECLGDVQGPKQNIIERVLLRQIIAIAKHYKMISSGLLLAARPMTYHYKSSHFDARR